MFLAGLAADEECRQLSVRSPIALSAFLTRGGYAVLPELTHPVTLTDPTVLPRAIRLVGGLWDHLENLRIQRTTDN